MKTLLPPKKTKASYIKAGLFAGAVFVIWAYHNSFSVPFLFDDSNVIRDTNPFLSPWTWKVFLKSRWLVYVTFAINHILGGEIVWGYHLFNLTVHLMTGWLLYEVVKRTLRMSSGTSQTDAERISLLSALLWLIHPLQTESVTYLSQRSEVMMGMFYLGMIYSFIRATAGKKGKRWYVVSVLCCALGAESKEVMVTGPILLLLYDRTFVAKSFKEAWAKRKKFYAILAGTCWLIFAMPFLYEPYLDRAAGFTFKLVTPWQYAQAQPEVILHYLTLAFWPHSLCFDYTWPLVSNINGVIFPAIACALLLGLSIRNYLGRHRSLGFLGLSFFLILAPTSSIVPVADLAVEHRMYLPLASLVVLAVLGIDRWFDARANSKNRQTFVTITVAMILVLGWLTFQRNKDYQTELTLWTDVVKKRPNNPRAYFSIGHAMNRDDQNPQAAIDHYLTALSLKPDYADVHNNLARTLYKQGKIDQAKFHFAAAMRANPNIPEVNNNIGVILMEEGKTDEAIQHFSRAIEINPYYKTARQNLNNAIARRDAATTRSSK